MYSLNIRCSATATDITFGYCEVHCCSFCTTAPHTFSGKRVCKRCCTLRSRVKQRRFGGHSLTSFTFHFGHAQLSRTRKDGSVETVQSVTFPTPAPTPKLIQCKHCEATFQNEQGYSVHRRMRHPRANAHKGTRLLKSRKTVRVLRCGRGKEWAWAVAGWLVSAQGLQEQLCFSSSQSSAC